MTYPSDDHRDSVDRTPLEHDRGIINGAILALAAFTIVAVGIVWFALTVDRPRIAEIRQPTIDRPVPDGTTGFGGGQPAAPAPRPDAK